MTAYFRHTASDDIMMDDGAGNTLVTSLDTFLQLEPLYNIKNGAPKPYLTYTYREYIPTVKHILLTADSQYAGAMPWTDGDTYLTRIAEYNDIIDNPTQDVTIAKNIKITALGNYRSEKIRDGGVSLFSTTMPSNSTYDGDTESYTRNSAVPTGFYLLDASGAEVTLDLTELQQYQDGLIEMRWLHRKQYDIHKAAIEALSTIEDVEAYDFTTGWPALPFVPS